MVNIIWHRVILRMMSFKELHWWETYRIHGMLSVLGVIMYFAEVNVDGKFPTLGPQFFTQPLDFVISCEQFRVCSSQAILQVSSVSTKHCYGVVLVRNLSLPTERNS
jgi:hypothetical protein